MQSTQLSRLAFAVGSLAVGVALTLGVVNVARAQSVTVLPSTSQQAGISVCGHGTANSHPDQAEIQIGVQANASTAENARSLAAQAMNAVLAALNSQGVASEDIQTDYFAIAPVYNYSSGTPSVTGYTASNNVKVTVHAVNNTGAIVDAVTRAGGNDIVVNGIQFSTGDPSQTLAAAQQSALANAHQQAEKAAQAAGVTLGAPISIQLNGCGTSAVVSPFPANGASADQNTKTPIQPGLIEVTADVGVVYAIS